MQRRAVRLARPAYQRQHQRSLRALDKARYICHAQRHILAVYEKSGLSDQTYVAETRDIYVSRAVRAANRDYAFGRIGRIRIAVICIICARIACADFRRTACAFLYIYVNRAVRAAD